MAIRMPKEWLALVGAIWVMLAAGGGYNFGLYSEALKVSLGYTQNKVSTIAFFRDVGANLGIHCGILYSHFGPRAVLFVGACLNFVGYFVLWLIVCHKVSDPGLAVVSLVYFLVANSQAFGFSAAMITSVENFPKKRGIVIGMVTGFIGLSGALLSLVFEALYRQRTKDYLLFNSWVTSGLYLLCMPLVQVVDYPAKSEFDEAHRKEFRCFSIFSFVTGGYLFLVILLKSVFNISWQVHCALTAVLVVTVIVVPLSIVFLFRETHSRAPPPQVRGEAQVQVDEAQVQVESHVEEGEYCSNEKKPERGDNYTVWQAVTSLDMWIIVLASTCGMGSVLAALGNMGQIGTAWSYSTHQITNSVSFISILSFVGRIAIGWTSEILVRKYGTPRPLAFAVTLILTAVGHIFIALKPSSAALLLASGIEGFALGSLLTMIFTMTSELFGLKNFATLYSMGTAVSTVVGTYLLSVLLAGNLFDRESKKQHHRNACYGVDCYRQSFLIMAGVCLFGACLSFVLTFRTRHFYKKFIA